MKDWFPLTSYDFYAYLTAGMIAIAAYDHAFMASALAGQAQWTVAAGVFWIAIAYLAGQIIAIPASGLLEHLIARRLLRAPAALLLGTSRPRWREKFVAVVFSAREYQPFPTPNRDSMRAKAAKQLGVDKASVTAEAAFQAAFPHARSVPDSATRLDNFINQYGMCRNVSFACLLAGMMLWIAAAKAPTGQNIALCAGAFLLAIGLFGRFLKFYAAYAREVLRTFDKVAPAP
ncbi:hypothetical protein [Allosphingosinicella sp.]|uniref:hypothetical protein n=1 Tax=Allosphingosinicella sp. TaxID=2823234 RepID=UPI00378329ED